MLELKNSLLYNKVALFIFFLSLCLERDLHKREETACHIGKNVTTAHEKKSDINDLNSQSNVPECKILKSYKG